jgi:hypothetical protein
MSQYTARIAWQRNSALFTDNRYSRAHRWSFDGGVEVPASSSPQVVPVPLSVAEAVDPEEAFVASLASCHMLWFLSCSQTWIRGRQLQRRCSRRCQQEFRRQGSDDRGDAAAAGFVRGGKAALTDRACSYAP